MALGAGQRVDGRQRGGKSRSVLRADLVQDRGKPLGAALPAIDALANAQRDGDVLASGRAGQYATGERPGQ